MYITTADTRPGDLDEDIIRGFELWYGAVFVLDLALLFEDEGKILRLG